MKVESLKREEEVLKEEHIVIAVVDLE